MSVIAGADGLKFKEAKIHFIYSFFLRTSPLNSELSNEDLKEKYGLEKGKPTERFGVPPNLRIKSREYHKAIVDKYEKCEFLGLPNNLKPKLSALLRLFKTGAGTITYTLTLKCCNSYSTSDIFEIYNLINASSQEDYQYPKIKMEGNSEAKRLIDLMWEEYECLEAAIDEVNDSPILDLEKKDKIDYQHPYIVVQGELINEREYGNCWDLSGDRFHNEMALQKLKEITLLLQRYMKGREILKNKRLDTIPLPFNNEQCRKYFRNYTWFEHIFVGSHPRATLILYNDIDPEGIEKDFKKILESVAQSTLDLFELAKSRWHFCVFLNELLDQDIEILKELPAARNAEFARNLLKRRRLFATYLSDPLTYSFGGGLVFDLIESAKRSFQLDYLNKMTESKFEVIDRVVNDLMRVNLLNED
jgi:hypothetical protein